MIQKIKKCVFAAAKLSFGSEEIVVEGPLFLLFFFFILSDNLLLYWKILGIPTSCILFKIHILLPEFIIFSPVLSNPVISESNFSIKEIFTSPTIVFLPSNILQMPL
jgi:hypothetical protein